jgi:cardiolipin synthase (CMP-forming)
MNPANGITLARLALIPFVIAALIAREPVRAAALFAVAALSDSLDGLLARRFGWTTRAGAYLDPIADKLLLSGVFLALGLSGAVPTWFVGLILGRDVLILAAVMLALLFTRIRQFPPSVWGKASTFFQILTASAWILAGASNLPLARQVAQGLIWPAATVTLISAVHYGWRGMQALKKR